MYIGGPDLRAIMPPYYSIKCLPFPSPQSSLELVGIVEDALCSGAGAKPLPSPMQLHRQAILDDQSAAMFSIENEVHNSCCVEFYLQV